MFNLLNYMEGVFSMFFLTMIILINVDRNYKSIEEDLKVMSDLCLKLESKPIRYDASEVTCSNNLIVTYRSIFKESK